MENVNNVQPSPPRVVKPDVKNIAREYLTKAKEFISLAKSRLNSDPQMKRLFILAGGAFAVIILLLITATVARSILNLRGTPKPEVTPTPEITASPAPTVFNPSRYATDSGVLSLEESVKGINRDAESLDIKEYNLRPPSLDFEINFLPAQ